MKTTVQTQTKLSHAYYVVRGVVIEGMDKLRKKGKHCRKIKLRRK